MNTFDAALLNLLIKDARLSFADIARQLNVSRAHARSRVQFLVDSGVIEKFTAVVNPEKLGKMVSTFVDLQVLPARIEMLADQLAEQPEVVSLYIMSDLHSLHIHTLTEDGEAFSRFASQHLLNNPDITYVDCKSLLKRVKHRRGGARL